MTPRKSLKSLDYLFSLVLPIRLRERERTLGAVPHGHRVFVAGAEKLILCLVVIQGPWRSEQDSPDPYVRTPPVGFPGDPSRREYWREARLNPNVTVPRTLGPTLRGTDPPAPSHPYPENRF